MQGVAHCLHLCYLRPADRLHRQKHRHYLYQNGRGVSRSEEKIDFFLASPPAIDTAPPWLRYAQ